MACITCPECGKEVSSEAKSCIHCGYPLAKKKKTNFSKKIVALACAALLILVYFSFFHLGADDRYAYDLVIQNSMYLENPQSIRVISGTAGFNPDRGTPYAFCVFRSRPLSVGNHQDAISWEKTELAMPPEQTYMSSSVMKSASTQKLSIPDSCYTGFFNH